MDSAAYDPLVPAIGYFIHRVRTPSWRIDESRIDFFDITLIVDGSADYVIDGELHRATRGDLFCIPPGSVRSAINTPGDTMESYAANFTLHHLYGGKAVLDLPLITAIGVPGDLINLYRELTRTWLHQDPGVTMKARAIFTLILHRLIELVVYKHAPGTMDPRVRRAMRYLAEHYSEPFSMDAMAHQYGLNPVYFGALFKQETGMLLHTYLTGLRMNQAEALLHSGEYSITETASLCGYPDAIYFRKQFKKVKGVLPSSCLPRP